MGQVPAPSLMLILPVSCFNQIDQIYNCKSTTLQLKTIKLFEKDKIYKIRYIAVKNKVS